MSSQGGVEAAQGCDTTRSSGSSSAAGNETLVARSERGSLSKRAATATFQKFAVLTAVDSQVTGHASWVTGAQAMAVAGVDVWLIQAFCRWGSRVILEYIRDCHLTSAEDVSRKVTHGLRLMEVRENIYERIESEVDQGQAVECERTFKQVLEARVAEMGIGELKHVNIKDQIEQGMIKNTRENQVKFVVCASGGVGMLVWAPMDASG